MDSNTQNMSTINQALQANTNAKLVYGEPVTLNHKIVLPTAKLVFGYGGGGIEIGTMLSQTPVEQTTPGGGGGGMIAYPVGVFEITEDKTRFIAASNKTVWAFSLVAFYLLGFRFGARKTKRSSIPI